MHDMIVDTTPGCMPGSAGLGLADILRPMTADQFIEEHWGKRVAYIRGERDKFTGLMNHKDFVGCCPHVDALQAYIASEDWSRHAAIIAIQPRQIKAMYIGGFTICAKGLEKASPALDALGRRMKAELHYSGDVDFRGYLSRHGSGAPLHFDARHATTLQLEGTKTWRFSATPSVPYPPRNAVMEDKSIEYVDVDPLPRVRELALEPSLVPPPPTSELMQVTLEPGDVLYLPPGTWHSAQAVGHSLAVNMAFNYAKGGTVIELLSDILYRLLYADTVWRSMPPVFAGNSNGAMPEPVRRFLDERLDDARRALQGLTASDPRVEAIWRRRIQK